MIGSQKVHEYWVFNPRNGHENYLLTLSTFPSLASLMKIRMESNFIWDLHVLFCHWTNFSESHALHLKKSGDSAFPVMRSILSVFMKCWSMISRNA